MKFTDIKRSFDKKISFNRDVEISVKLIPTEPVIVREHFIKDEKDGKHKLFVCSGDGCEYCITYRTLMKHGKNVSDPSVRELVPRKRYFLPIKVEENDCGIEPGEYAYSFGPQIHTAYIQLLTECEMYNIKPEKGITFNYKVSMKHDYPSHDACSFTVGKKTLTVSKLCDDAKNIIPC